MHHTIDSLASALAATLADYLANNWVEASSGGRTISADTNMVTELQLDSFQVMEFMLEVEDQFDVAVDLESLSNIETIRQLAAAVIAAKDAE